MSYLWWNRVELYNLREDPMERKSLADSRRRDARLALIRLGLKLKEWQTYVSRPLATRDTKDVPPELPPELKRRLKALGYLNH